MNPMVWVLCWPLMVVVVGWRWRPRSGLVLPGSDRLAPGHRPTINQLVRSIGACLRRLARRPPDPMADGSLGVVVLLGVALAVVSPPLVLVAPALGWTIPRLRTRSEQRKRARRVTEELPSVVDLLVLAAGAGLPALSAIAVVADRSPGPVGSALARAGRQIDLGEHPDEAFAGAVADGGESVRPLAAALLSSLREGTPLEPALERVGDEARRLRRREAEESARRVPVKLLFPLVLCTLPAFALLTVVPLLVSALGSLHA